MDLREDGIVILSADGVISYTNNSWKQFAQNNDLDIVSCNKGINYFKTYAELTGERPDEVVKGIRDVIEGRSKIFKFEHMSFGPDGKSWFLLQVQPLSRNYPTGVILQNTDITKWKKMEMEQIESETYFFKILNNLQLAGIMLDSNANIIFCNDFLLDLAGWKREEVLNKNWFDLFLPADLISEIKKVFLGTIENADLPTYHENEIVTKDGHRRLIAWNNTVLKDRHGKISSITSVGEDITDLKLTERSLLNSSGQLRTLLDTIPDLIWLKDQNGVYLMCNPKFERFFGAKEAEIIGKTDYDFVEKDLADFFTLNDRKAMALGKPSMNEEEITYANDGHKEYLETIKSPMYDSKENLIGVLGVGRDITRRKQAEDKVREEAIRRRILFEQSMDGLVVLDQNGKVFEANLKYAEMLGYSSEEIQELYMWDWDIQYTREQLLEMIRLADSKGIIHETKHRRKDGSLINVEISGNEAIFNGRKFIFCVCRDITERKQAEDMLLHAKLAAEDASKSKGEFLATMSHELRTPLNSIIGFSDMMLAGAVGELNEKQVKYMIHILNGGRHLLALINDILDLSKVEAGKMKLNRELFSVYDAIEEVKALAVPLAVKKNIEFDTKIESGLEDINADKTKIKQILYNLASNAIKFTEDKGYVGITAQRIDNMLVVSVIDTGRGISMKDLGKLFQPFKQLNPYMTREHEGTGLGLVLVKKYVEMHGGNVRVESEVGKGSIFTFTIPYC